jgi:hypothetical protein
VQLRLASIESSDALDDLLVPKLVNRRVNRWLGALKNSVGERDPLIHRQLHRLTLNGF